MFFGRISGFGDKLDDFLVFVDFLKETVAGRTAWICVGLEFLAPEAVTNAAVKAF
uniref:Uncharacterized protein n=1 Tax=viral metagenome TaxID=1070528 RepID=A0A6M3XG57_9ZZZZ